jgi:5-methylcytosine-specific restriction endonuclease McrA
LTRRRNRQVTSLDELRDRIEARAGHRCEYCRAPQSVCGYRFHLDHICPTARGGSDAISNRALACASCNLAKGDKTQGTDSLTGREGPLFHPRKHAWSAHFRWSSDQQHLLGRTAIGRATIAALDLNGELRLQARLFWFETGWLP